VSFSEFKTPGPKRYRLLKISPFLLAAMAGHVPESHCPEWPKGARIVCSFWDDPPQAEAIVLVIEHESFEEIQDLEAIPTWLPLWVRGAPKEA